MYYGQPTYQSRWRQDTREEPVMCPFCGSGRVAELSRTTKFLKLLSPNRVEQKHWRCRSCRKKFGYPSTIRCKIGGMPFPGERFQHLVAVDFRCGGFILPKYLAIVRHGRTTAICIANWGETIIRPAVRLFSESEWDRLTETLFKKLFIHHWNKEYVNPDIYDGEQWEITLHFASGKAWSVYGSNAYPPLWGDASGYFGQFFWEFPDWPPTPTWLQSGELFRGTDIYGFFSNPMILDQ